MGPVISGSDWRTFDTYYRMATSLSDRGWAWEFLRRNPKYRAEALNASPPTSAKYGKLTVRECDYHAYAVSWGLLCFRKSRF